MRNQPLDILRGIAIILVLGFHYSYFRFLWQVGWSGVDLFFVLSGFLVSGLLFDEYKKRGQIDVVRFWIRRGFKIYPPFYLLMLVTLASLILTHKHDLNLMWPEFLFLQSYFPHLWPHTWSLAVEEHFYFTLPILLILTLKLAPKSNPMRLVPWMCGLFMAGCLILRTIGFYQGMNPVVLHTETHLRVDGLFAGVLMSYWYRFHQDKFKRIAAKPLWLIGLPLLVPTAICAPTSMVMDTFGLTMLYLGFACILAWSIGLPQSKNFLARGLAWIGKYSYSIYLWHLPLWAILYRGRMSFEFFLVGVTISILFGAAMAKLIEIPSLKVRDRLFPQYGKRPVTISRVELVALKKEIA